MLPCASQLFKRLDERARIMAARHVCLLFDMSRPARAAIPQPRHGTKHHCSIDRDGAGVRDFVVSHVAAGCLGSHPQTDPDEECVGMFYLPFERVECSSVIAIHPARQK